MKIPFTTQGWHLYIYDIRPDVDLGYVLLIGDDGESRDLISFSIFLARVCGEHRILRDLEMWDRYTFGTKDHHPILKQFISSIKAELALEAL